MAQIHRVISIWALVMIANVEHTELDELVGHFFDRLIFAVDVQIVTVENLREVHVFNHIVELGNKLFQTLEFKFLVWLLERLVLLLVRPDSLSVDFKEFLDCDAFFLR